MLYPKTGVKPLRPQPPLSLLALSPYLEARGLMPVIVDQRVDMDYAGKIRRLLPHALFVGITSMTGEQLKYAVELIDMVKRLAPDTPVVFGGIHVSLLPEQAIKTEGVDIVAIGEGEAVISDIADYCEHKAGLESIRGICYRKNDRITVNPPVDLMDLKELKTPSWHLIDTGKYTDFTIQAGRGCPNACTYCHNMKFSRGRWRFRGPGAIIDEIKHLHSTNSISDFFFVDDNFFSSLERVEEVCALIVKNNLPIKWKATCRADYFKKMSPSFIGLLKKSGIRQLFVGGESGSPDVLKRINKKITVDDIMQTAEIAGEYGLPVSISFMTGFPFETAKDRELTFGLMDRLKAINPSLSMDGVNLYTPYPGNELYEESKNCGFKEPDSLQGWSTFVFNVGNLPWFSRSENNKLANISFISRFVFWERTIKERFLEACYYPFYLLLRMSALVRWKLRLFGYSFEWDLFRFIRIRFLE